MGTFMAQWLRPSVTVLSPRLVAWSCAGARGCSLGAVDLVQGPGRQAENTGAQSCLSPEEGAVLWALGQARREGGEGADAGDATLIATLLQPTVGHRLVGLLHSLYFTLPQLSKWHNIQF